MHERRRIFRWMKGLNGAAVLLALTLVLSACASGRTAASGTPSQGGTTGAASNSQVRVLSGQPLPAPLLKRIAAVAWSTAMSLGDTPRTVQVYGPDSRYVFVKASSGDLVQKTAAERRGFYLIVVRGQFVCDSCSGPPGANPPRGTIMTDVWSPRAGGTDFGVSDRLGPGMARLQGERTISLSRSAIAALEKKAAFKPAAVSFISPDRGWLLGTAGGSACAAVRMTTDGGRTWRALPSPGTDLPFEHPSSGDVSDVAFADPKNGFLFGPALLASHDGGSSWTRDSLPPVQALGIGAGYAFALSQRAPRYRATLWRERVGRDGWSRLPLPKAASAPLAGSRSSTVALAVEGATVLVLQPGFTGPSPTVFGRLWSSNDAGKHWEAHPVPCKRSEGGAAVIAIARDHPRSWLIDCYDNEQSSQEQNTQHHLYETVNAGASWTRLADPTRHNAPNLLAGNGAGHIFLTTVGAADFLVGSLDTGRHWNQVVSDGGSFYGWADLRFLTARIGFVVGPTHYAPEHLYRTTNGGRTWRILRVG